MLDNLIKNKLVVAKNSQGYIELIDATILNDNLNYQEANFSDYIKQEYSNENISSLLAIWKNLVGHAIFKKKFATLQSDFCNKYRGLCKLTDNSLHLTMLYQKLIEFETETPILTRKFQTNFEWALSFFRTPKESEYWQNAVSIYNEYLSYSHEMNVK